MTVTIPIPLFQGLPQETVDQLLSRGVQRSYPRNCVILNEGDEASSLYIVLSGRLKVFRADAQGKQGHDQRHRHDRDEAQPQRRVV